MNRPATFTPSAPADDALHVRLIASLVLEGNVSGLPRVDHQFYDFGEWIQAAQYVADTGDTSEFAHMLATERGFDRWMRLSDAVKDRWISFGDWLAAHKETAHV
ncbi:hypothetical protein [Tsuneonella sp. HG222]